MWDDVIGLEGSTRLEEPRLSQIRYSLVIILELNGGSEVQYKDMMMVDDRKYQ